MRVWIYLGIAACLAGMATVAPVAILSSRNANAVKSANPEDVRVADGVFVSDFVVARFNANGSLDLSFGTSGTGQVATDIGSAANSGRNLVLQPNGAIVVSGTPQCSQPGCEHTDVVRYNAAAAVIQLSQ